MLKLTSKAWRKAGQALCLIMALIVGTPVASAQTPLATIKSGQISGQVVNGISIFEGIPFAAPPIGARRWQPPVDPVAWTGTRAMLKPGPSCLQADYGWNKADAARGSEDCLYLDVGTPDVNPATPLPVMVWIHGGANHAGSAAGTVRSMLPKKGVVVVSIQYRMGVFGFLSHPALTAESVSKTSGNYALLDMIKALEWVRDNIQQFGGDPGNVTIFGHSAGGQNVSLLVASPKARSLFHKAISQSGTAGFGLAPRSLADNEAIGLKLGTLIKAPADPAANLAALRSAPASDLLLLGEDLGSPTFWDKGFIWLQPVIDGDILPANPLVLLRDGRANPVPLIIGGNTRELTIPGGDTRAEDLLRYAYGPKSRKARALYNWSGQDAPLPKPDPVTGTFSETLSNDVMFLCPAEHMASRHSQAGQKVYRYYFDRFDPKRRYGHSGELDSIFNGASLDPGNPNGPTLADYWVQFAKSGAPVGADLPNWPRYEGSARAYILFGRDGIGHGTSLRSAFCARMTPRA